MALKIKAQGAGERATVVKDGILRLGVKSAIRRLLCRFVDETVNWAHFKFGTTVVLRPDQAFHATSR